MDCSAPCGKQREPLTEVWGIGKDCPYWHDILLEFLRSMIMNNLYQSRVFQTGSFIAPSVKAGDTVLLPEYGGTKINLEDKVRIKIPYWWLVNIGWWHQAITWASVDKDLLPYGVTGPQWVNLIPIDATRWIRALLHVIWTDNSRFSNGDD